MIIIIIIITTSIIIIIIISSSSIIIRHQPDQQRQQLKICHHYFLLDLSENIARPGPWHLGLPVVAPAQAPSGNPSLETDWGWRSTLNSRTWGILRQWECLGWWARWAGQRMASYAAMPILLGDWISISRVMGANQNLEVEKQWKTSSCRWFSYLGRNVVFNLWPGHARDLGIQDSSSPWTFTWRVIYFWYFVAAGFELFFGFLVLCFPASLLSVLCFSCLSAFVLYLLLFFSASLLSLLLCFTCFFSCLLLCFTCFAVFSAFVPFDFYYPTFSFLQLCVLLLYFLASASLLPVFTASLFFLFFCFILSCL